MRRGTQKMVRAKKKIMGRKRTERQKLAEKLSRQISDLMHRPAGAVPQPEKTEKTQ